MLPLVVHIERAQGGPTITRVFHESPVRVGRSPFASLRLREPFVSEWHGVVRFHGERTTYLDLGSRNPTHVQGQPIERNVEVEIDASTDVRIGTLRLRFERITAARELPEAMPKEDTAFIPEQLLAQDKLAHTVVLSGPAAPAAVPAKGSQRPPPLPGGPKTVMGAPLGGAPPARAVPSAPPAIVAGPVDQSLAGAERDFERARSAWLGAIKQELDGCPAAQRAERVRALHVHSPRLAEEPLFRQWAQAAGVDPVELGHVDVAHWLNRLCGASVASERTEQVSLTLTMERAGQLLELFASAFIESRRAHQRARKKLGLDSGQEAAPKNMLQQSEDPHAVLAYLLEPTKLSQTRSQELRRSLGDFAMHQIALLSAVVEGARAMLGQLSPHALEAAPESIDSAAVLDSEHSLAGVWPFAAKKLWRRFLVRHHDLVQTDHFARELFGREFTRRYHAIADSATHIDTGERT